MNKDFDGLIFDMDGILVDVARSYREAIRQTAGFFLKREVTTEEVSKVKSRIGMNNDWDATYALIDDKKIPFGKVKMYFQKLYLGDKKRLGLIDNEPLLISKQQLVQLKNKYKKMGIATGRPRDEVDYVIKKNRLTKIFDCIVGLEDVDNDKPDPDSILQVIQKIGLKNTVYIGDSPSDVEAAKRAGIPSIYVGKLNIGTTNFQSILQVVAYLL